MSHHETDSPISRRQVAALFAAASAAVPAALAQQQISTPAQPPNPNTTVQQQQQQRFGPPPPPPEPFAAPIAFTRKYVPLQAQPFPMAQVRLLPGSMFHDAQEWNRGYMSRLPADRLIHNFRLTAGLPSTAEPLGGWEEYVDPKAPRQGQTGELRGHFTGHFLSASAFLWASTGDKEAKAKADYMVAELAKCQQKLGLDGYLSAFPITWFDPPRRAPARVWAPFYTIHKIMAGMFDMYQFGGNQQALEVLEGMANWADKWTASKTEEHMQEILNTEYGGMAEMLYNLAAASPTTTNGPEPATASPRSASSTRWPPARTSSCGLHVNTHVPQVIAAARRYEISGDARFHDVADFFC